MKLYFTYEHVISDNYLCWATFENGWCAFTHICSDPGFMFGDLWDNRPDRQEIIKLMGIDAEPVYEKIRGRDFYDKYPQANMSETEKDLLDEQYRNLQGKSVDGTK